MGESSRGNMPTGNRKPDDFSCEFYNTRINNLPARIIDDHCNNWVNLAIGHNYFEGNEPKLKVKKMQVESDIVLSPNCKHTFSTERSFCDKNGVQYLIEPFINTVGLKKIGLNAEVSSGKERFKVCIKNPTSKTRTILDQSTIAYVGYVGRPVRSIRDLSDEEFFEYNRIQRIKQFDISKFHFGEDVPSCWLKKFKALITEFSEVWTDNTELVGRLKNFQANIEVTSEKIVAQKPYKTSLVFQDVMNQITEQMFTARIIEPSDSPYSSPCMLVPRKTGNEHLGLSVKSDKNDLSKYKDPSRWRLVTNFIEMNKIIACPKYPVPLINDVLERISKGTIFCTIDLCQAYYSLEIKPECRKYTSFVTPSSQWNYRRVPYGMSISPSTFSKAYNKVLCEPGSLFPREGISAYADDSHLYARSYEALYHILRKYLEKILVSGLTLKISKSMFLIETLKIFGHILSKGGLSPDPDKISAIRNFIRPVSRKGVQSFMGLVSFCRRYIPNCAHYGAPLSELGGSKTKFRWEIEHEEAFQYLKKVLSEQVLLSVFDNTKDTYVFTDCSALAVGACLCQMQEDGYLKPISFYSKILGPTQRNYGSTQLECYASVSAIENWHRELITKHFTLVVDNHALLYLKSTTLKTQILQRYAMRLNQFSFTILYNPGTKHSLVDSISRFVSVKKEDIDLTSSEIVEQPWEFSEDLELDPLEDVSSFFVRAETERQFQKHFLYFVTEDKIRVSQNRDKFCGDKLFLYQHDPENPLLKGYEVHKNILCKKTNSRMGEAVIPVVPEELIPNLLHQFHNEPQGGHLSHTKVYDKIKSRFYMPNMHKHIKSYIAQCEDCQYRKCSTNKKGMMKSIYFRIPFKCISYDIITDLPSSDGYTSILCVLDYCTKFAIVEPMRNMKAITVANILLNRVIN